jgi:hypothetical protein
MTGTTHRGMFKDDVLARLADKYNVAQFASFGPGAEPQQRHLRITDPGATDPAAGPADVEAAIELVLRRSAGAVNVRSFRPEAPKGNPFRYDLTSAAEAASIVRALATEGYHTIVNETIDIADGGVSGVALGEVIEFSPLDTPRAVEKPGATALPRDLADRLLATVYGFAPRIPPTDRQRVEFSIHPLRVGVRREHTIVWETAEDTGAGRPLVSWPDNFSRFVGDKAYGLLVADAVGLPVPLTTVIGRNVAPFRFGGTTGSKEVWLRTCPAEQVPGHYTTRKGWTDPYRLLHEEDPSGKILVSVLAQESVPAVFSGASRPVSDGPDLIEGVAGHGDRFMLGQADPQELPTAVLADVRAITEQARRHAGPVRTEWAHDGRRAWVLQLHVATNVTRHGVLSAGDPAHGWVDFDPDDGLTALERLVEHASASQLGVALTRAVGYTSHVGDLLRRAGVPGRFRAG